MSPVTGSYQKTTKPPHQYLRRAGHLVDAWDNYITRMLVTQNHLPQTYISKQPTQHNQCNTTSSKYPTATNPYNSTQPNPRQTNQVIQVSAWVPELPNSICCSRPQVGWVFFSCGEFVPSFWLKKPFRCSKKPQPIVTMVLNPLQKKKREQKKKYTPSKLTALTLWPLNFLNGCRFVQIPGWEFHLFSGLWWEVLGHRTRPSWIWSWRAAAAPPCRSQQITHEKKKA